MRRISPRAGQSYKDANSHHREADLRPCVCGETCISLAKNIGTPSPCTTACFVLRSRPRERADESPTARSDQGIDPSDPAGTGVAFVLDETSREGARRSQGDRRRGHGRGKPKCAIPSLKSSVAEAVPIPLERYPCQANCCSIS